MSSDRITQPKAPHSVNYLRRLSFKPWIRCNWHNVSDPRTLYVRWLRIISVHNLVHL